MKIVHINGRSGKADRNPHLQPLLFEAVLVGLLVATTVLAYWRCGLNSFVNFDDDLYAEANPRVQSGLSLNNLRWAWTTTQASNWHPLTWLSLQLDAALFGVQPWGFHVINVVLHGLNSVLLFAALRRLTGAVWPSGLAAGFFCLHPLHVESVAWIAERKDVLSGLFWMLALWWYAAYAGGGGRRDYLVTLLLFALGLLAKPMVVTLPCVLLLLDYWPLGRFGPAHRPGVSRWRLVIEKVPFFALALAVGIITIIVQQRGGAVQTLTAIPLSQRLANVPVAYATYLYKTIWPLRLAVLYPFPWKGVPAGKVLASLLLLAALSLLAIRQVRPRPYLLVGWLWFLGTLVPVIGLIQVGNQALADRYTYLPLIGVFIGVAWGLRDVANALSYGRQAAGWLSACALLACGVLSSVQVGYWRDGETLWTHAVAVTRENYIAHDHLAEVYLLQGDEDKVITHETEALRIRPGKVAAHVYLAGLLSARGRFEEAVQHYQAAIKYGPPEASTHLALGNVLLRLQRFEEARDQYLKALERDPASADAVNNLGTLFMQRGQRDDALRCYQKALQLDPGSSLVHNNLGLLLLERNRLADAAEEFHQAIRLRPDYAAAFNNLGDIQFFRGQWRDAIDDYRQAVQHAPREARYHFSLASALRRLEQRQEAAREYRKGMTLDPQWPARAARQAWRLATDPDPHQRQPSKALFLAQQACEALEPRPHPRYLDVLAAAYADAGRFDKAVRTARQALEAAQRGGQQQLADEVHDHLQRYERRESVRQAKRLADQER
jgi:tetratricopeptide (TPR) repeat protein